MSQTMASKRIFIAYDFEIKKGLIGDFQYVKRNQPEGVEVDWAGRPEGMSQGEIWRNRVRPAIDSASRFVAYVDLPNANVGFEIGYALGHGEGKEVALARVNPSLPDWLNSPPFNGFFCPFMQSGKDLLQQLNSDSWFKSLVRPELGKKILLLCPPISGFNFIDLIKDNYPTWLQLPEDGWSLNDLPEKLQGVGAVVWLIVPHREGREARDGQENAAASVVAGFTQACGMHLKVLRHTEARGVADVAPQALEFESDDQVLEHLKRVVQELEALLVKRAPETAPEVPTFSRPYVGFPPELDTAILRDRFIGRGRLLGDLADALRGLVSRRAGELTEGGARVQAI
jgi:hypothetical protein